MAELVFFELHGYCRECPSGYDEGALLEEEDDDDDDWADPCPAYFVREPHAFTPLCVIEPRDTQCFTQDVPSDGEDDGEDQGEVDLQAMTASRRLH